MPAFRGQRFLVKRRADGGELQADAGQINKAGFLLIGNARWRQARDQVAEGGRHGGVESGDTVTVFRQCHAFRDAHIVVCHAIIDRHNIGLRHHARLQFRAADGTDMHAGFQPLFLEDMLRGIGGA